MKELESFKSDEIGIHAEQQQKKEIKLIDRQRKIRGLILWEFNTLTKLLKAAEFKKQTFSLKVLSSKDHDHEINHKVVVKENHIYFQALNRKNAERKLRKSGYNFQS